MLPDLSSLDSRHFERTNIMEALVLNPAGVAFLQWLVALCGFNKPSMSMEDAARRDVWINLRPYIPVEKLSEIEHQEIRIQQQHLRELLEFAPPTTEDLIND